MRIDSLGSKVFSKEGKIPNIAKKPGEMLGKIDALIVDHRHPKYHLKAATPFIKRGIPVFIDKPFCFKLESGKEFLKIAKKNKAAVTSFSVVPMQKSFNRLQNRLKKAKPDYIVSTPKQLIKILKSL